MLHYNQLYSALTDDFDGKFKEEIYGTKIIVSLKFYFYIQ